jgi:hypothetical protein
MPLTKKEEAEFIAIGVFGDRTTEELPMIKKVIARCEQDAVKAYKLVDKVNKDAIYETAKAEERKRIIAWIKSKNPAFSKMSTLNNENAYLIIEHELAELEKGDE